MRLRDIIASMSAGGARLTVEANPGGAPTEVVERVAERRPGSVVGQGNGSGGCAIVLYVVISL